MSNGPAILCAGEAVIDLIPADARDGVAGDLYRAVPGGAALNTACAVARMGAPAGFLGALSTDRPGQMLAEHAARAGVDLRACLLVDGPTPLSLADLDGGDARYAIYD